MTTTIDFYFDFVSGYSYLANIELQGLRANRTAEINYQPVGLLDLMKLVGNRPTSLECASKGAYVMADVQRYAKRHGLAFSSNPHWQGIDFAQLGRGALVAIDEGQGSAYVNAVYAAMWGQALDLGQPRELLSVLAKADIDGTRLLQRAGSDEYIAKYDKSTAAAAARGVFGSPTMFVGEEMFFGNDRMDLVAEAIESAEALSR